MSNLKTSKSVDTNRIGEALKKAGIDPRSHVSIGIIAHDYNFLQNEFLADDNDIIKDKYGIYANVILTPELTPVFCKIAPAYAGAFGGLYYPYHLLDTVLVVVPDGNLNNYPAIIGHYYTGTETLPDQIDLKNMWLVLEDGANANIITLGGDANIDINGKVDVKTHNNEITLASDGGGVQAVGRVNDKVYSDATDDATFWAWIVAVQAVCSALNLAAGKVVPPITMPSMPTSETGHISTGSSLVKAGG